MSDSLPPSTYGAFFSDIKQRVASAQTRATMVVNSELVRLYWGISVILFPAARMRRDGAPRSYIAFPRT